jgi:hypothetical protein
MEKVNMDFLKNLLKPLMLARNNEVGWVRRSVINGQLPEVKNMARYDAGQDFPKRPRKSGQCSNVLHASRHGIAIFIGK